MSWFSLGLPSAGCAIGRSRDGSDDAGDFAPSGRPLQNPAPDARLPIIWVEASVCTGCSTALLASTEPTIETLLPELRLEFQETLMDKSGPDCITRLLELRTAESGKYLLIVDGAISAADRARMTTLGVDASGHEYTAQELVTDLASHAAAVLALGTCSSFGGIPAARPNPAGSQPLANFVPAATPLVRVPGCPPNPGWIVETLSQVLHKGVGALALDARRRPLPIFANSLHDACPRKARFDAGEFATVPGDPALCFFALGCRGRETFADCTSRLWNGRSSCIASNHPCIGCAAPEFPDGPADANGVQPFYYDS